MDYEKKYKEALEKIREKMGDFDETTISREDVEEIFPDLSESEDDKIICQITHFIKHPHVIIQDGIKEKWIAWLENKNVQKSFNEYEPKFKNGQWIIWKDNYYKVNYNGCGYELIDQNGLSTSIGYRTIDENAHLWDVTKDAKDGDILFADLIDGYIFVYNGVNQNGVLLYSFLVYNAKKKNILPYCIGKPNVGICSIDESKIIYPATKEQREKLEKAMFDAGYKWNDEGKELKNVEELTEFKNALSKEKTDELIRETLIAYHMSTESIDGIHRDDIIKWLKNAK